MSRVEHSTPGVWFTQRAAGLGQELHPVDEVWVQAVGGRPEGTSAESEARFTYHHLAAKPTRRMMLLEEKFPVVGRGSPE